MNVDTAIRIHRFGDDATSEVVRVPCAGGIVALVSRPSPERPDGPNEDAVVVVELAPDAGVIALADGMGGQAAGARASRAALEAIVASLHSRAPEDELRTAILNGFEMANEAVRAMGVGAGTTLAVVEIQPPWVRTYHVGDSGIVLTGQRGRVRLRTVDHSPAGYAVEAGLLDDRQAIHHAERHLLINQVGSPEMRIEIGPSVQMAPRDTLLVASDGLFDNVVAADVVERIRRGPLDRAVASLASLAQRRMTHDTATQPSKPDDLTLAAFRLAPGRGRGPVPGRERGAAAPEPGRDAERPEPGRGRRGAARSGPQPGAGSHDAAGVRDDETAPPGDRLGPMPPEDAS